MILGLLMLPRILSATGIALPTWTQASDKSPHSPIAPSAQGFPTTSPALPSSFQSLSSISSGSLASSICTPGDCIRHAKDKPATVGRYFIVRAEYCKSPEPLLGHEFLVFWFQRRIVTEKEGEVEVEASTTYVVVERQAGGDKIASSAFTNFFQVQLKAPTAPAIDCLSYYLSKPEAPVDVDLPTAQPNRGKSWSILATLYFPPEVFPLEQLYVMTDLISKHSPEYHPMRAQCFWYAGVIWRLLKEEFMGLYEVDGDAESTKREEESRGLWEIVSAKIEAECEDLLDSYRYSWAKFETAIERRKHSLTQTLAGPKLALEKARADAAETRAELAERQLAEALSRAQDAEDRATKAFNLALSNEAKFNDLLVEYRKLTAKARENRDENTTVRGGHSSPSNATRDREREEPRQREEPRRQESDSRRRDDDRVESWVKRHKAEYKPESARSRSERESVTTASRYDSAKDSVTTRTSSTRTRTQSRSRRD